MSAVVENSEQSKYVVVRSHCVWDKEHHTLSIPIPRGYESWDDVEAVDIWSLSIPFKIQFPKSPSEPQDIIFTATAHGPRIQKRLEDEQRKSKDGGSGGVQGTSNQIDLIESESTSGDEKQHE
jgi:hypothetical protein